jgi:hypothetical protein
MLQRSSASPNARRWLGRAITPLFLGTTLLAPTGASAAQPAAGADPAVIATWDEIAANTIFSPVDAGGAGKANAEGILWMSFIQAATYNAVVGITGAYDLYKWDVKGPKTASSEAAAAVAAHRVLMTYFGSPPTVAATLDAALATSLARIPDGVSKDEGISYGKLAADRIIELRTGDGRAAPIAFNVPLAPGVWRPAPPTAAPFFDPWLGQVKPLMLDSGSQFRSVPPPAIASDLYVQEFNEVRDYGAKISTVRTNEQRDTALFFFDIAFKPIQAGLRDLVGRHGLDISDSARLFAAVDMSLADSTIAVWDGKLYHGWWRPITSIREADNDGNPLTAGVPGWEPLVPTPPYPDWPSGLSGAIGALSTTLSRLNADGHVDITIISPGTNITRHYDDAAAMQQDVISARVWAGIHFRTADQAGAKIGVQVGTWALDHYFKAVPAPVVTPAPVISPAPQITAPATDIGDLAAAPLSGGVPWIAVGLLALLGMLVLERALAHRRR